MRNIAVNEKTNLVAKLMATENISVSFSGETSTAYFDLKNRALVMPILEGVSNSVIELFIAHEISHALHTPHEAWTNAVNSWPAEWRGKAHMTLNILEDARIEKLIKKRYPGVVRSMKAGYKELHERNFFGLDDNENINERGFLDRTNLYFKSYGMLNVSFSEDERELITRISATESFEDVVKLAEEILGKWKEEKERKEEEKSEGEDSEENTDDTPEIESGSGESSDESETESAEETESESEGSGSSMTEESETEESESEGNSAEDTEESSGEDTEENDDSVAEDDASGTSAEESEGDTEDAENAKGSSGIDFGDDDETASTVESMEEAMKNAAASGMNKLTTTAVLKNEYLDNHWKDYIVPASRFLDILDNYGINRTDLENMAKVASGALYKENLKTINNLVKEFDMKKAASLEKRAMTSKTGDIDADRLHSYRTNEDIFLSNTTLPEGKNHGIVMYLDLSGSMNGGRLEKSLNEIFNMIMFAEKVGLPYRVYGFSNANIMEDDGEKILIPEFGEHKDYWGISHHNFGLFEIASSANNRKTKKLMNGIIAVLTRESSVHKVMRTESGTMSTMSGLANHVIDIFMSKVMSQTPSATALYIAPKILREFRKTENVEKPIFFFYTDGMANDRSYFTEDVIGNNIRSMPIGYILDPESKEIHDCSVMNLRGRMDMAISEVLLKKLRSEGVTTMMFIIANGKRDIRYLLGGMFGGRVNYSDAEDIFNRTSKTNTAELNDVDFVDSFIVINGNRSINNNDDLENYMGNSKDHNKNLENAFKKMHKTHKGSRVLVRKVIETIA